MGKRTLGIGALAVVFVLSGSIGPASEVLPIGKKIDNFACRDFRGKLTSLADFSTSKLVVVAEGTTVAQQ